VSGGTFPLLESTYSEKLYQEKETGTQLEKARALLADRKQPVLSGYFPVTGTVRTKEGKLEPVVVFRTQWGLCARYVRTGKLVWPSKSEWGLDAFFSTDKEAPADPKRQSAMTTWLSAYLISGSAMATGRPQTLLENSVIGALSSDGEYV